MGTNGSALERLAEASLSRLGSPRCRPMLAAVLRRRPGSWLLNLAHRILPARQPIGVLAVILKDDRVLVLDHLTRTDHPRGLPGGWLGRAERPEDGLRRELHEELGLHVTATRYLLSVPHRLGSGPPHGLTLVYRVEHEPETVIVTSAEILGAAWLPVDEAIDALRDFEQDAVRLALRGDEPSNPGLSAPNGGA